MLAILIGVIAMSILSEAQLGNLTDIQNLNQYTIFSTIEKNYDRKMRPNYGKDEPVDIEVYIHVTNLGSISEVTMTYELDIYLREEWKDPRLVFDKSLFGNKSHITLHEDIASLLWLPDTFLPRSIEHKPAIESNTHKKLLRLKPDGYLLSSKRLSLKTECPMDLTYYPFDQQICRFSVASYGYDIADILYHWKSERNVTINQELELPDFKIVKIDPKYRLRKFEIGTFSGLELCFFFERRPGYFVMAIFFPASHIVAISWLSLWLSNESTLSDIIQIILAMIFLNFTQNAVMPKVSYIKALDVFMGTCFFLVFLALLKLSVHKFLHHRNLTMLHRSDCLDDGLHESDPLDHRRTANNDALSSPSYIKRRCSSEESLWINILLFINNKSFAILIVIFLGFCFFYFAIYAFLSQYSPRAQCSFD